MKKRINKIFFLGIILQLSILSSINASEIEYRINKNTTWGKNLSPIFIEKNVIVEKGAKLTIEPGVVIKFKANLGGTKVQILVDGTLIAKGEENNLINFTADAVKPGVWGGIIFNKTSGEETSIIEYCKIEYATSAIGCFTASPKISNNSFLTNEVGVVCEDRSSPSITGNYFFHNGTFQSTAAGVSAAMFSNPEIKHNILEKNIGYGVCVSTFSAPLIYNNSIGDGRGRGIQASSYSSPSIINNKIYINGCSCGIVAFQCSPIIMGNSIYDNRGYAISLVSSNAIIHNNYIHENGSGILNIASSPEITSNYIKENKGPGIIVGDNSEPIINYNHIEFISEHPSIRLTRTSKIINMKNNWWGTTDKSVIEKSIKITENTLLASKVDISNFRDKEISPLEYLPNLEIKARTYSNGNDVLAWGIYGDKILFNSYRDNNWEIYMTNTDGTMLKNLTNNPYHDVHPVFSPDGQKFVFSSKRNGNSDIFVANLNDNSIKQITDTSSTEDYPSWSPDGTKIAFKQIENLNDFYTINADGTNRTRLDSAPAGFYDLIFVWMPAKENINLTKNE